MADLIRDRAFDHVVVVMFESPGEEYTHVNAQLAQPVAAFDAKVVPPDAALSGLGRALCFGLLALGEEIGQPVPDLAPDTAPTGSEAVATMRDLFGHMFPNLQSST